MRAWCAVMSAHIVAHAPTYERFDSAFASATANVDALEDALERFDSAFAAATANADALEAMAHEFDIQELFLALLRQFDATSVYVSVEFVTLCCGYATFLRKLFDIGCELVRAPTGSASPTTPCGCA